MTNDDARPPEDDAEDRVSFSRPRTATATASEADRGRRPPAEVDEDEDYPDDRRRVVVIAAVVFVVIALVGFALTRGGGDDDSGSATTEGSGAAAAAGEGEVVTVLGTEDPFDRADTTGGVDPLPNGVPWEFPNGTWEIRGSEVALVTPSETRNFMVVDVGISDVQAEVRMAKSIAGAGLTFRYQDEFHFWALEATDADAINIIKVDNEAQGPEGSFGVFRQVKGVAVADGSTLGVIQTGNQIQVLLDGKVVDSFEDPYLAGTGGVGLTARGLSESPRIGEARWDDFVAGGPSGEGIIGAGGEGLPSAEGEGPAAPTEPGADEPAEEPGPTETTAGG